MQQTIFDVLYPRFKIDKIIRIPLNAKIKVKKENDEYIITLEDYCDTNLFIFKENQVDKNCPFSIERLT